MTTEKINTIPKHTKASFIYAGSLAWHKLSYYGWRSILFLVLFEGINNYSESEMMSFFLWLSLGLAISYLIGGIIGDFLIGNKKTTIIGGILIFIGAILFFFISSISPYLPITIFIIGCGLYQSNLKSIYAKLYLHDKRLLDSGFILLNLFINLGSFLGAMLVGLIAYSYGAEYGFLTVGISTAISVIMLLLAKEPTHISTELIPVTSHIINRSKLKYLTILLALFGLYCFALRLTYSDIYAIYWNLDFGLQHVNYYWVDTLSTIFYIVFGIYLVIIWSKKYYDQITKLTISTIITLASFALSYFLYREESVTTTVLTIIVIFAYTFAKLLVEPLIDSSIAKSINQNYFGIAYGAISILSIGIGYVFLYMEKGSQMIIENSIYLGFSSFLLLSIILLFMKFKPN